MEELKLNEKEQKGLKGLSKAVSVFAKIFKVLGIIASVGGVIMLISLMVLITNTKFDTTNRSVKLMDKTYTYKITDNVLTIDEVDPEDFSLELTPSQLSQIEEFVNVSNVTKIGFVILLSATVISSGIFLFLTFKYVDRLFVNIHDNDTPFIMENVLHIRKIVFYLMLLLVVPYLIGLLIELIFNLDFNVDFNLMYVVYIMILVCAAHIFKYGCLLQSKSKEKIYD